MLCYVIESSYPIKLNVMHVIESNYPISDCRMEQFQLEIKTDESFQTLLTFIQNGWPKNRDQIP